MKSIKIKAIISVLVLTLASSYGIGTYATPNGTLEENQSKYEELTENLNKLTEEIMELNAEIEQLSQKIAENELEVQNIELEIENTKKEIESIEEEIEETKALLENRIRELYKQGGQANYLMLLINSESFNDFFTNLEMTTRLVNLDREIMDELDEKQKRLDEKNKELENRSKELEKIIKETEKALLDVNDKREKQEVLKAEAEEEQVAFDKDFLSIVEEELISGLIETINNSSSSEAIKSAITQLSIIKDVQLRSPIVIEKAERYVAIGNERYLEVLEEERLQAEAEAEEEAQQQEEADKEEERPSAPEVEEPNEPEMERPSEPEVETPSEPEVERPSEPEVETPSEPEVETPSEPEVETPSAPEVEQPSEPEVETPTQPAPEPEKPTPAPEPEPEKPKEPETSNGVTGNDIVNYAYQFIGTPYLWGGTTPAGFDCSGFTSYVYRHAAGIEISRTTYSQYTKGISVSYSNLRPGDLVFAYGLGHVGIYVGNGNYIHAPSSGDSVKIAPIHGYYGARRIIY